MADQDPYGAIKFGEFRKYMQNKQSKLKEQEAILGNQAAADSRPILQGLSIHVNGYTDPPQSELRRMIVQYGGDYQHYLKKSKVTHIIATTLTNSKMQEFRSYKVVKPSWITDSIKAGEVLPWTKYRVIRKEGTQKELPYNRHINESDQPLRDDCPLPPSSSLSATITAASTSTRKSPSSSPSPSAPTSTSPSPAPSPSASPPIKHSLSEPISRPHSTSSPLIQGKDLNAALLANPWNRNNSTANPEFVKRYYQSSRLHHLSLWKAELKEIVRKAKEQSSLSERPSLACSSTSRRLIMHVDFDCFFASVSIKRRPELAQQPVAVSHGKGLQKKSSSDIASCNYIARSFGIRNGMHLGKAKELCPNLQIVPYEFEEYRAVSEIFYNILFQYADEIQAVSVDEALLDVASHITQPDMGQEEALALKLRNEIREKTGCEASVGLGPNIMVARLATKAAKPCNHYYCKSQGVQAFLSDKAVGDLPGVGYAMESKLEELNVVTIGQLKMLSLSTLTSNFGPKTGQMLFNFARGIDNRPLSTSQVRQSVSAEVNWGVRFETKEQAESFLDSLSAEVSQRLQTIGRKGKNITLKILVRSSHAGEAEKHLGCGECDSYSRSVTLDSFTDDAGIISKHVKRILKVFDFIIADVRGVGIQIQKLNVDDGDSDSEIGQSKLQFGTIPKENRQQQKQVQEGQEQEQQQKHQQQKDQQQQQQQQDLGQDKLHHKKKMAVDYNAFMELPLDIQNELKQEYELELTREPEQISRDSPKEQSRNQSSLTTMPADIVNRDLASQSLPYLPSWSQLDPTALLALPANMQRQVLEAYGATESAKTDNCQRDNYVTSKTTTAASASAVTLTKSSSLVTDNHPSKITKSPQSKRTKSRLIKKKDSAGVTLTQLFRSNSRDPSEDTARAMTMPSDPPTADTRMMNHDSYDVIGDIHPKDMEIWPQLPKDIQQELLDIYRQKRRQKRDQEKIENQVARPMRNEITVIQTEPKLMGRSELSDIRCLLGEWVTEFASAPDPKDIDTVTKYLKELVWFKDLEKAQLLLMYMDHITRRNGIGSDWLPFIERMKQTISKEVEIIFSAPLALQ